MMNHKAWPYIEAQKIVDRNIVGRSVVFETGYGPSGLPHIGTFAEVARTSMVRRAYEDLTGNPTRLIVFSDDLDALRKVPDNIPNREEMEKWIGYSLSSVPDPFGTHESFAHHNNAMLRKFLDQFGFDYEFMSSTDCYRRGVFDDALSTMWEKYDDVLKIILPTLGEDRHATYSPFMPILAGGRVISEGVRRVHSVNGAEVRNIVGFPNPHSTEETPDKICSIGGGRTKCQWKADWALRWLALGVDYEMCGKDLTDSAVLSSRIVRALGGRPPVSMIYEMFLDENGEKISKSHGNGLTIEQWLEWGSRESLEAYLYRDPKSAKKIGPAVVPRAMDDLWEAVTRYQACEDTAKLNNPVHHLNWDNGPPQGKLCVSYQLLLNLAQTAQPETSFELYQYVDRAYPDRDYDMETYLHAMVIEAFSYHREFCGEVSPRSPTENERVALLDLISVLRGLESMTAQDIMTVTYEVGKTHYGKERLREWFSMIYEVLIGQDSGPRFGVFAELVGLDRVITMLEERIK